MTKCLRYCCMVFILRFANSSTTGNAVSRKSPITSYLSSFRLESLSLDTTMDLVIGVSIQTTRHLPLSNLVNHETGPTLATSFHSASSYQSCTFKSNSS